MKLVAPKYYERFRCKGGKCKNNCCIGWEIDVDESALAKYIALDGELGKGIRKSIDKSGDAPHFILDKNERCPHLNSENLCDIICELGEGYLCHICREHPRYYTTLGDTVYGGVGMSCEAAAELILGETEPHLYGEYPDTGAVYEECDGELHGLVLRYRDVIVTEAQRAENMRELLTVGCELGVALQREIDGNSHEGAEAADIRGTLSDLFSRLEYMGGELPLLIDRALASRKNISAENFSRARNIFIYFIDRYLMGAAADGDAIGALALASVSAATLGLIYSNVGADFDKAVELAALYSAEIEYSEENVENFKGYADESLLSGLSALFS